MNINLNTYKNGEKGLIDFIEEVFISNNEFSSTTEVYLFWSIFFATIIGLFIFIL